MTDSQLIELFWQRSEAAIAATDRCYGSYCRSIAYYILRNHEDAAEIVNDTWLKLWNLIPPQRPDPLKGLLGRITRQLSINRLEFQTAQKRGSSSYALALEELGEVADGSFLDPGEAIALREALERFLRQLPGESRRIFLKRYWYFLTVEEIAKELGLGQSKVKMRLYRTRQQLRDFLEKEELL